MRCLILDARNGIAAGIARGLASAGAEVVLDDEPDLSSMREVRRRVLDRKPDAVIVPRAYDDPALCEADPDLAFRRNAEHMIHVAAAALEVKARPVLISTAEVFGRSGGPWSEGDPTAALSTWTRTRLQGESFFLRASKDAIVVRAGPILADALEEARARFAAEGPIAEAEDEMVSPIGAAQLGVAIHALVAGGASGLFHAATREEPVSRAEFLRAEAAALGLDARRVVGKPGRSLSRKVACARSPALLAGKLEGYLKAPLSSWRDALAEAAGQERREEKQPMGHRQEVKRVEKPWGHEIIWAHTERYVGKILFVKQGERLSLQYHEKKDETVYVLSGKMVFEVGPKDEPREDLIMKPGDSYHITPLTTHRMIALEDTTILEASTPELGDVVRLEDKYGRAGTSKP